MIFQAGKGRKKLIYCKILIDNPENLRKTTQIPDLPGHSHNNFQHFPSFTQLHKN